MSDDYRLHVAVDPGEVRALLAELKALDLDGQGRGDLGRVAVSHDDGDVFLYADSEEAIRDAGATLQRALEQAGVTSPGEVSIARWHPVEERWEDASAPLPASDAEREVEDERLEADEQRESQEVRVPLHRGPSPEWEVRVTLASREEARHLCEQLTAEGIPVVRRFHHLLLGANSEQQARELAARVREEAPPGSEVTAEGSGLVAWQQVEGRYAFMFGGLAG